jgi:poly-gamma-glutamate synthesis protein (capsule biosynthesis protein)
MLVVSAHWGANFGYVPEPEHIPFAHALIDHGADIIFGHSSHVFRGVEIYQGRPIFYSAGDFIDDYAIDLTERNDESFIFLVEAEPARIREVRLHPVIIENMQANLSDEVDQTSVIIARMRELCHRLKTKTAWREAEGYLEIVRSAP